MQLKDFNIKNLLKAKKERNKILKSIDHKDLIDFGKKEIEKAKIKKFTKKEKQEFLCECIEMLNNDSTQDLGFDDEKLK